VKTESVDLKIADSKDDLKIETVTFRDKLQPGQKEKWTIKISGADKEKINAEVLANMYDKSLDQFAVNSWNWQKFYSAFYESSYAIGNYLQQQYYRNYFTYQSNYYIQSPDFNWFDGRIYYGSNLDTDGDGIPNSLDACPKFPEHLNIKVVQNQLWLMQARLKCQHQLQNSKEKQQG
jgi:hypothetical protein